MNREIIFRGFNVKHAEWRYGYYFVNRGIHFIVEDKVEENPFQTEEDFCVEPKTIGQYTGMTDTKGNKIFEGDILANLKGSIIGVVRGGVRGYCYDVVYQKPIYDRDWPLYAVIVHDYDGKVVVVGNIHNNPELMKGGEK